MALKLCRGPNVEVTNSHNIRVPWIKGSGQTEK